MKIRSVHDIDAEIDEWRNNKSDKEDWTDKDNSFWSENLIGVEDLLKSLKNINTYPLNAQGVLVGKLVEDLERYVRIR